MKLGALLATAAIVVSTSLSVGGGATFVALEATTKPEFCRKCHIMEPYYQSWAHSSHNNVTCVDCHYEPGLLETFEGKFKALSQLAKYATQTQGSKPWAEVSDYSCMRSGCHSNQLLEGEIRFGRVRFDHRYHLIGMRRGKTLRCTSCHSQIVQGDHLTVTTSSCFLCHFKSGGESKPIDDCNGCHGPPTEDIVIGDTVFRHSDYLDRGAQCADCHGDVTRGTGEVPRERCGSCHNKQEHLERIGDVDFIHRKHVTEHSVTCLDCHLEIQHGLPPKEVHGQGGQCGDCHSGTHSVATEVYRGAASPDVPEQPAVMFEARVTCRGCHRPPFPGAPVPPSGATFAADPLACLDCHGPGFEGMVEKWQSEVRETSGQLQHELHELHARLSSAAPEAAAQAGPLYDSAARNLGLVLLDRSEGAHNLPYVRSLLSKAAADAREGWRAVDPTATPPETAVGPRVASQDACTTMCHVGAEHIEVDQAAGLRFDHAAHLLEARLDCSTCHSAQPHGTTTVTAADCRRCHHQSDDAETCANCHAEIAELRAQPVPGLETVPMQDVDCLSCHLGLAGEAGDSRPMIAASCEMCHAGEGRTVTSLVEESARPLDELEERLGRAPPERTADARAAIAALRRAGPFHNAAFVKATAERLAAGLEPPEPAPPPAAPENQQDSQEDHR